MGWLGLFVACHLIRILAVNGLTSGRLMSKTGTMGRRGTYSAATVVVGKLQVGQLNDGGAYPRTAGGDGDKQGWLLETLPRYET